MTRRHARPYAQALWNAAGSLERAVEVRAELGRLVEALVAVPKLGAMSVNPAVPMATKERILAAVGQELGLSELGSRLVGLLVRNYRLNLAPLVFETFGDMVNRRLGVAVAEVETPQPLDAAEQERLKAALGALLGHAVELKTTVEPRLLGGFKARIGSTMYDGSVKGQLDRLAQSLVAST
ncbi:MAG: ATP synthase F1 subunit delta [Thermoanaerobaculia bacterium]|nr:ATP synthase F1 subunit delta [Thermoanaerobaculia bacterium]